MFKNRDDFILTIDLANISSFIQKNYYVLDEVSIQFDE